MFNKGTADENFDVTISYDVLNTDPEKQENKLNQMVSLLQLDRNGRINVDNLLTLIAGSVDPVLADGVLEPVEVAQEKLLKDITDDLSKIYAGIEVPARPSGAQAALQVIQQYSQQPDVQQRLQEDEAFAARLQKYAGQYQFAIQQAQNAQIGRIGTQPALIQLINALREECIADMHEADTDKLQQLSGRIITYDQILQMVDWQSLQKKFSSIL
jgi:hypothetical protein